MRLIKRSSHLGVRAYRIHIASSRLQLSKTRLIEHTDEKEINKKSSV